METRDRDTLAELLRKTTLQTISEVRFWEEFHALTEHIDEPLVKIARQSATNFWEIVQRKKTFFLIPVKPSGGDLRQATDELKLIAAVLETGWALPALAEQIDET